MTTHRFVCQEHEDFGTKGWRQQSQPGFDPLGGMAVAHDIIEHFPNGDESPADEFQALGASLLIRQDYYYASKGQYTTSPALNAASDMPEIIRHVVHEHMHLPEAPKTLRLRDGEELVQTFVRASYKLVRSEFEDYSDDELAQMREVVRKSEGWVRIGYRRAQKRYAGKMGQTLSLFCSIERMANRLLEQAEEGQVMVVCIADGESRCWIEDY